MKKIFWVFSVLALMLFVGGFLMLKAAVLDQITLAETAGASTKMASTIPSLDTSSINPDPSSGVNGNPHGNQAYSALTPEQRQQADSALNNVETALSEFLKSEVAMGLMSKSFADKLQENVLQLLTVNRSPLSNSAQQIPGSNI